MLQIAEMGIHPKYLNTNNRIRILNNLCQLELNLLGRLPHHNSRKFFGQSPASYSLGKRLNGVLTRDAKSEYLNSGFIDESIPTKPHPDLPGSLQFDDTHPEWHDIKDDDGNIIKYGLKPEIEHPAVLSFAGMNMILGRVNNNDIKWKLKEDVDGFEFNLCPSSDKKFVVENTIGSNVYVHTARRNHKNITAAYKDAEKEFGFRRGSTKKGTDGLTQFVESACSNITYMDAYQEKVKLFTDGHIYKQKRVRFHSLGTNIFDVDGKLISNNHTTAHKYLLSFGIWHELLRKTN